MHSDTPTDDAMWNTDEQYCSSGKFLNGLNLGWGIVAPHLSPRHNNTRDLLLYCCV